jgi:arabinogalactan endo-1,4-beta-galactosidase
MILRHRQARRLAGAAGCLLALFTVGSSAGAAAPFIAGADASLLAFFESNGIAYQDRGQKQDALVILKNHGINTIRLRLFTSSASQAAADPYDYINNLAYTVPLAVRVKHAGLKFLLDFHYSDTWADPGHQATPAAWANLDLTQLSTQMRAYNSNCIAAFASAGAMPDYVQVGNEITGGILWTNGAVPGNDPTVQWPHLAQLLNAAIQGIHDSASNNVPQIIIHIDRGGDWNTTEWFFDNLIQTQHVQFDIIGQSYYPFWHGSLGDLANCLTNTAIRYGKPVLVAETAFPWTNTYWTTNLDGFAGTTNGQAQYTIALIQAVKAVPQHLGAGVCWWGSEYQKLGGVNEAGFDTTSLFDNRGNVLPAADVLGQSAAPLLLRASIFNTNLDLEWPLSGAGLNLQTSTGLDPSSAWTSVTSPVQITNATFQTTLPMARQTNRFFRLQSN